MLRRWNNAQLRKQRGQSLIETALALPLLLCLAFNAVNYGYFWYVLLSVQASARNGVQYSTQGGLGTPSATDVYTLTSSNLTQAFNVANSDYKVQVCSAAVGVSAGGAATCTSTGMGGLSYTFDAAPADPNSYFILHRVDVVYHVTPIIPGPAFNVLVPSNLNFHRQVSMRSLF